ncbi:MAG: helix-turn-helix domain-containing protein [Terricaulis sp.]
MLLATTKQVLRRRWRRRNRLTQCLREPREAKAAFADPSKRAVPISTIALDAGFASLGPFNRAFKAETDKTPSEHRDQALVQKT